MRLPPIRSHRLHRRRRQGNNCADARLRQAPQRDYRPVGLHHISHRRTQAAWHKALQQRAGCCHSGAGVGGVVRLFLSAGMGTTRRVPRPEDVDGAAIAAHQQGVVAP